MMDTFTVPMTIWFQISATQDVDAPDEASARLIAESDPHGLGGIPAATADVLKVLMEYHFRDLPNAVVGGHDRVVLRGTARDVSKTLQDLLETVNSVPREPAQ